jgi:hypothetical protein
MVAMVITFGNGKMAIYAANEKIQQLPLIIKPNAGGGTILRFEKIKKTNSYYEDYVPLSRIAISRCKRQLSCDQIWKDINLFSHKSSSLQRPIHDVVDTTESFALIHHCMLSWLVLQY